MGRTLDRRSGLTLISLGLILLLLALLGTRLLTEAAWRAYLGAVGTALIVLGAPPVLFPTTDLRDLNGQPISSWYFLLSEPNGGYSLSRLQFLIWFLPAFAIWVGASIKAGDLIPLTTQWLTLLGVAGGTSILGSLTSVGASAANTASAQTVPPSGGGQPAAAQTPPSSASILASLSQAAVGEQAEDPELRLATVQQLLAQYSAQTAAAQAAPAAAPAVDPAVASSSQILPPRLRDAIEDFDGHGDVTRYQYLLLSFFLATSLVVLFWHGGGELPVINENLWPFVAASSGSYLGTKFVKQFWAKS